MRSDDPHQLGLRRSRAYHAAVAERLASEPTLVDDAVARLARWSEAAGRAAPLLEQWRRLLLGPRAELIALLLRVDEPADELRSCTPFAGALAPRVRWALWRSLGAGQAS